MKMNIVVSALFGTLYLVMLVNFVRQSIKAPVGYEDKDGFHVGNRPSKPK